MVWDLDRMARICNLLEEKWSQVPDQRLGQFLKNYVFNREEYPFIFDQEDKQTEERLSNLDIELVNVKLNKPGVYLEELKKDNYRSLND